MDRQTDKFFFLQSMKFFQSLFSIFCEVLLYITNHKRRLVVKFSLHFINVDTGTQNEDP
jgi:hypothetical protein